MIHSCIKDDIVREKIMEHKPTELGHFCWSFFQYGLFRMFKTTV